jgi:hypothetical protein
MKHRKIFAYFLLLLTSLPGSLYAYEFTPAGDVFQPLFADPKEIRSMVNYFWTNTPGQKTAIASMCFGEHFGFFRWSGPKPNEGWQWGLAGGIFAQFDMHSASKDLLNTDFLVGFPLTWRKNKTSARFRVYHQSSHLGDEFLLDKHPDRINLNYEAFEFVLSQELGAFRPYLGGEWLFDRDPHSLKPFVSHAGVEFRTPLKTFSPSDPRNVQLVLAIDEKTIQDTAGWDFKVGFEFGSTESSHYSSRRWSMTWEHYQGPSPYSQFFAEHVSYTGGGFQLGF